MRATPDDAYRFAKGEPLKNPLGHSYQLSRPLDFMAVTDHAIYMGAFSNMEDPDYPFSKMLLAQGVLSEDPAIASATFKQIFNDMVSGKIDPQLHERRAC